MKEMERHRHKAKKAARKVVGKTARAAMEMKFEECQWLLCAMFEMEQNYQIHTMYPLDTDKLE
jgi:hypothetical protein